MPLSTTPETGKTLETVTITGIIKKHGKLLTVLAIVIVSFTAIYFLTKTKPLSNGS